MISLPTGSGKTRVAVQALVDAMRLDEFKGGILWIADRDELCEQAVESWAQVWGEHRSAQGNAYIEDVGWTEKAGAHHRATRSSCDHPNIAR